MRIVAEELTKKAPENCSPTASAITLMGVSSLESMVFAMMSLWHAMYSFSVFPLKRLTTRQI